MGVALYMDVHVPSAITHTLRIRGVDVLTSQEDGTRRLSDELLLDRATSLGRVLFSRDEDLLAEATLRQRTNRSFAGLIYAHQLNVSIGGCVSDLEIIANASEPAEWINRVEHLPL